MEERVQRMKHLRPRHLSEKWRIFRKEEAKEDGAIVRISTTEVWPPFFTNWRQNLQQDLSPESHSYAEKAVRYDAGCWLHLRSGGAIVRTRNFRRPNTTATAAHHPAERSPNQDQRQFRSRRPPCHCQRSPWQSRS